MVCTRRSHHDIGWGACGRECNLLHRRAKRVRVQRLQFPARREGVVLPSSSHLPRSTLDPLEQRHAKVSANGQQILGPQMRAPLGATRCNGKFLQRWRVFAGLEHVAVHGRTAQVRTTLAVSAAIAGWEGEGKGGGEGEAREAEFQSVGEAGCSVQYVQRRRAALPRTGGSACTLG